MPAGDEDFGFVADGEEPNAPDDFGFTPDAPRELHTPTGARRLVLPETTIAAGGPTTVAPGPATEERDVAPPVDAMPRGHRETGRRMTVLPETTIEGSPTARGPRQATVAPASTGYQLREVEADPGFQKRDDASVRPVPPPTLLDRLRTRVRGHAAAIEGAAGPLAPLVPGYSAIAATADPGAAVRGAVNAASLGFSDEYRGAADTAAGALAGQPTDYRAARDEHRRTMREAEERAPGAFGVGELAGSAPSVLIPGAGPTTALGRIAMAGGQGALGGMIRGAGESEAEDTIAAYDQPSLARDAVEQGALEGVMSAGMAGAGEAAVPLAQRIGRWATRAGERMVEPAARLRNSAAGARYAPETDRIDDPVRFAETLRESGISTGLRTTAAAGERAAAVRSESNRVITDLANQASEAEAAARAAASYRGGGEPVPGTVTLDRLAAGLGRVRDGIDGQGAPATGARSQIDAMLERYREAHPDGVVPLATVMGDWRAFGKPSNFAPGQPWNTLAESGRGLRREFRSMMEEAMESASGPQARAQLSQALERVHAGRTVERGARRVADRQSGNRLLSPTDYYAAGTGATAGMMSGDPLTGVAAAALAAGANRAVRGREHAIGALALETLAPRLRAFGARGQQWAQTLDAAQRRGSTSLAAAHAILQRRDPAYRQAIEEMDEAGEPGEE